MEQYGLIPANPILLLMDECCILRLYWHHAMKEAVYEMTLHTEGKLIQWYQCTAKKLKVAHLFLCLWTANGTICSALGVLLFKSKSSNNPLKAGANDKVGLCIRAAVIWNQRQLFWERKCVPEGWTKQMSAEGWPWGKVLDPVCIWSTSGTAVLNWNFIIKILQDMYVKTRQRWAWIPGQHRCGFLWIQPVQPLRSSYTAVFQERKKLACIKLYPSVDMAIRMEWQDVRQVIC